MIHTLCVFQKVMHGANGNVNTENYTHVIGWLLSFCIYACCRPIQHALAKCPPSFTCAQKPVSDPRFPKGGREHQRWYANQFWPFSRKLHKIEKKMAREEGACLPSASLDPPIKTSVADLSICMWSLTLISRLRWAVYLDVWNKQCRWWCNVNWTVFIQGQRRYVVYVPLIHRYTQRLYTRTRYPSENAITDPK